MDQNNFQQIVSLLLGIKHSLQKGKMPEPNDILFVIDKCISKLIPYVNSNQKDQSIDSQPPFNSELKSRSVIVGRSSDISFDSDNYSMHRKSHDPQILKINQSFFQEKCPSLKSAKSQSQSNVLQDYFVLRYNLAYNDYEVYGKKKPSSDRKVFVDLLTFDNKRSHICRLEKTQSMTNILRQIFSQAKPSQAFILPNFQEDKAKYLFVFGLPECGSIAKEYFRTQTICCFVTRQFMLGQLNQLMIEISRVCFQQQVNQASRAQDGHLSEAISLLHGKKTYQCMEGVIEKYLSQRDSVSQSKLFTTKIQKPFVNSVEEYLSKSEELWTFIKKDKEKQLVLTLVLLYYLVLCEYKIVLIANTHNKHKISELILGLARALHPLTYIYPIVGTTITHHHFQFANSPVPIFVGFWGSQRECASAKGGLRKVVKAQKDMSASELCTETLMAVIDLQDHSSLFFQGAFSETRKICKKIHYYLEGQTEEQTSVKLSNLTKQLLEGQGHRQEQWMLNLTKNLKVTQMYDYLVHHKK